MLWILPLNDGEAVEIRRLLDEQHQRYLVTRQPWGANWKKIEKEILATITNEPKVYAIELAGVAPSNVTNIDHHDYGDDHSRINSQSSLEQVAAILNVKISRWRQLVAANDRGYYYALAKELHASKNEIASVRLHDRRAQGVKRRDEIAAWNVLREIKPQGELWKVQVLGKINSAYGDLLYTACKATQWLLQSNDAWIYSGPRHKRLMALALPEPHWSGGDAEFGFFGIANPCPSSQAGLLAALS